MPTVQERVLELMNQPKSATIDGVKFTNQSLGDAVKAMEALGAETVINDSGSSTTPRIPALLTQTMRPGGTVRPV